MPGPILWGPSNVANNLQGAISLPDGTVLKRDGIENYIKNFNLDSGLTTGFATYANTAGPAPVTGTGGAPNSTIAAVAYTGFGGSTALQFVKGAANRQGEGFSYAFSIDADDQAKVLTIEAAYIVVSGTFAAAGVGTDSDMNVWIYDVTNATVIQPVNFELLTSSTTLTGQVKAQFQTASNSTSYRLIFHCATTSTAAYTLNFGKFKVYPQQFSGYGMLSSDWAAYTPVFSAGWGTVTGINCFYRRMGDSVEIQGYFTAGTTTASIAQIGLPAGLTSADTTKIPAIMAASGNFYRNVAATQILMVPLMLPSVTYIEFSTNIVAAANSPISAANANSVLGTGESGYFFARVPILGWSSSSQVISSYDGSIAAARITGATATITGTYSDVSFTTVASDSKAAYVAPNYTIPTSGYYDFSGSLNVSATTIAAGQLVTIGLFNTTTSTTLLETTYVYQGTNTTATAIPFVFNKVLLNAGTQIKIQVKASTTSPVITASSTLNYWSIGLNSGAQQILAGQDISARYYNSATAISGALATVSWTTKDFDTVGQMVSGQYTILTPGKYNVKSVVALAGTFALNTQSVISLQKNTVEIANVTKYAGGAITNEDLLIDDIISCIAGDVIRIQVSSGATGPAIVNSNTRNYFSIKQVN